MNIRSTRSYLVVTSTLLMGSLLPGSLHAQSTTGSEDSSDPVVVNARATAKAVAAAAPNLIKASPAQPATPAPAAATPASTASGSPASPTSAASASPAPAASGSPTTTGGPTATTAAKTPVAITTVGTGTAIPAGSPVIIVQTAPAASGNVDSTPNNWIGGLVGLGLLAAAVFFGIRAAKNRGITVEDALKRMGVETHPAQPVGPAFAQIKPVPAPLPPLPSLTELPLAGPASAAGLATSNVATARRTATLLGVAGPVAGERFDLEDVTLPFSVGRDDVNSLALTGDGAISRKHAQIARDGSKWTLGDLGSSNGTFVNGVRVIGQQPLRTGDEIQIGGSRFRFEG